MAMRLEKELKLFGCDVDPNAFEEMLGDVFANMFPGTSDEDLLYHPYDALQYCKAIRARSGCDIPDHVILRRLINCRKRSRPRKS